MPVVIQRFSGPALEPYIADLARLRIAVFREFPYLYEGSLEYETRHLRPYLVSKGCVIVLALDDGRVVGASTGMPLEDEGDEIQAPFKEQGYGLSRVFYFGESVLEPAYRGQGIGVRFFQEREAHVRELGAFEWTTFCAVERPRSHPRRPSDYVPLDDFWRRRGYEKHAELQTTFTWRDLDEERESPKPMVFWLKHWHTPHTTRTPHASHTSASAPAGTPAVVAERPASSTAQPATPQPATAHPAIPHPATPQTRPASTLRIAAAQYPVEWLDDWQAYAAKVERWTAEGAGTGARLLVFPEYGAMELASLFGREVCGDLTRQLDALQSVLADFRALWSEAAVRHSVYLLAPSIPVRVEDGAFRNRAWLFAPNARHDFQDKLIMTRFEDEQWRISPGTEPKVFETELGTLAVNICYDSEFPLVARSQCEAGAEILLVPSCTDGLAGYHRVRIGSQARALENQCFVVQSPLVGTVDWSEAVDVNVGAAAVYTPADRGFPEDGVLARGELNRPMWVVADLDLPRMRTLRAEGQVLNYRDWPRQRELLPDVTRSPL